MNRIVYQELVDKIIDFGTSNFKDGLKPKGNYEVTAEKLRYIMQVLQGQIEEERDINKKVEHCECGEEMVEVDYQPGNYICPKCDKDEYLDLVDPNRDKD